METGKDNDAAGLFINVKEAVAMELALCHSQTKQKKGSRDTAEISL
ncbi:hypothetical protein [Bartonella heixiaziensis]